MSSGVSICLNRPHTSFIQLDDLVVARKRKIIFGFLVIYFVQISELVWSFWAFTFALKLRIAIYDSPLENLQPQWIAENRLLRYPKGSASPQPRTFGGWILVVRFISEILLVVRTLCSSAEFVLRRNAKFALFVSGASRTLCGSRHRAGTQFHSARFGTSFGWPL